ncbi:MAG: glycoside hydrolase family 16 protein [Granulosicoccaceae bacterium]
MIYQFSGCSRKLTQALSLLLIVLSSSAFAIDTPPNPRGSATGDSSILWEWNWVPGVEQYEVTIDGQTMPLIRDPRYVSNDLWVGEHSMRVRAISSNWEYSSHSDTIQVVIGAVAAPQNNNANSNQPSNNESSNEQRSAGFGAPSNPRGTQTSNGSVQWEWNAVSGASNYEVAIDGAQYHTTSETRFTSNNLWSGEHSMSVKAINNNWQYSAQSSTVKVNVSENGGNQSNHQQPAGTNNNNNPNPSNDSNNPPPQDNGLVDPQSWTISEASREGYELVFSDEFNGGALNPARWNTQLRWDGEYNGERYEYRVVNGEDQLYVNIFSDDWEHRDRVAPLHNPFEFDGNRLAIRAARNPLHQGNGNRDHGPLRDILPQQPFLSGALSTFDKFSQKYGYFEARMRISNATGSFPAFWLHHQNQRHQGTARTEIDIMENLGHAPWYVYNSFHYFTNVSAHYGGEDHSIKPYPQGQISNGTDFSQGYHTYAVEWAPGYVAWFIDGQRVSEVWDDNVNREDLYIIMNLAIGGNWTNFPTNSGGLGRSGNDHFPNQNDINNFPNPALEIDWVRAYRRR